MESIQVASADGIRLSGINVTAGPGAVPGLAFVLAHGFTVHTRRPEVRRIAVRLARSGTVVALDFRGHGRSGGRSTVGDLEVLDVDAAVAYAWAAGHERVVTVGFSMGGGVVVRHAAGSPTTSGLAPQRAVDAVVAVSAPSRWYVRDTSPMRRVHWLIENRYGRVVSVVWLRTRLGRWPSDPESPREVAGRIPPTPFLVVQGDADAYFGPEHGRTLADAAGKAELWEVPGFGHAEGAITPALVDRIAAWAAAATGEGPPGPPAASPAAPDPPPAGPAAGTMRP